jgi:M6 family metalloprotease-like protein
MGSHGEAGVKGRRIASATAAVGLLLVLLTAAMPPAASAASSCALAGERGADSDNAGPTDYRHYLRPRGPIDVTVIFADFSDAPGDATSTQQLYDSTVPAADTYLRTASRNRVRLRTAAHHLWLRMPQPSSAYGFEGDQTAEQHVRYFADAVAAADPHVDFGNTDVVFVFSPPGAAIPVSPTATPGRADGFARADGQSLGFGVSFGNDLYEAGLPDVPYASHVAAHELLHTFGLPDLYRSGAPFSRAHLDIGAWDLMGWIGPGFGLTTWHLRKLGWLSSRNVTCLKRGRTRRARQITTTLRPVGSRGGRQALVIPLSRTRAWVVESRQRIGLDSGICRPGVLVYKVDSARETGRSPFRALAASKAELEGCGPLAGATFGRGSGRRSTARDRRTGLTVRVLRDGIRGSRVKVTIRR